MTYQLGIDLGTTFTAAAVNRDGRVETVTLGTSSVSVPTVVHSGSDEMLFGVAAERRAGLEPSQVSREFKRRVGDPTPILLGGRPVPAEMLMARLLDWVVTQVATTEGAEPDRLAVTHPANWGEYKLDLFRQAIRQVGRTADLLVSEPVAAATHYATQRSLPEGAAVAVYDLGGGTFDAAVVHATGDGFDIVGQPDGVERLGGIDFDHAVLGHVLTSAGIDMETLDETDAELLPALAQLRRNCIEAKETLSTETDVAIPVMLPTGHSNVRLTRSEFEDMIRPSVNETLVALHRAIESAKLTPADLSAVLLVGGSSRIPLISQLVMADIQRPLAVDARPKDAIPSGATLAVAALPPAPAEPTATPSSEPPAGAEPAAEPPTGPRADSGSGGDEPPMAAHPPSGPSPRRRVAPVAVGIVSILALALLALNLGGDNSDSGRSLAADDATEPAETGGDPAATADPPLSPPSEPGPLTLGRVLPETGTLAFLGPPQIEALRMAVDDINAGGGVLGGFVELLEADEGPEPAAARSNVLGLLDDGANVIVGAAASGVSQEFIQVLYDNQVPQCSASNTAASFTGQDYTEYFYRTAFPEERVVDIFVEQLIADGHSRVAIAVRADNYGLPFQDLLDGSLEEEADLEVVYSQAYAENVVTFDAEVGELMDADADAIVVAFFDDGGDLLQGLVEQGFDPANVYGSDGLFSAGLPAMVDQTDPSVIDGMRVIGQGGTHEFNQHLAEVVAGGSTIYGAQAYDCGVITALAAERAGVVDETLIENAVAVTQPGNEQCSSFEECRQLLDQGQEISYRGVSGVVLDANGDPTVGGYGVSQFADGELEPLASHTASR